MDGRVTVTYDLREEICLAIERRAGGWEEVVAEHVAQCRPSPRPPAPREIQRRAAAF